MAASLVCVRRYSSPIEANIVRGLIEEAGIAVQLEGEALVGAYAGVPKVGDVRLLVRAGDEARARDLIESYEQRENGPEWICDSCGESNGVCFEVCWQCAALVGTIVGGAGA